jgi:hypothetical protein
MTKMTKYFTPSASSIKPIRLQIPRSGLYFLLLLVLMLVSSCGTIGKLDKSQSDMMPKSVAISIFEKYGYKEWAEKPYLFKKGVKTFVEYIEIKHARYVPTQKALQFWKFGSFVFIPNVFTEAQALELANAARALGATNIEELTYMY